MVFNSCGYMEIACGCPLRGKIYQANSSSDDFMILLWIEYFILPFYSTIWMFPWGYAKNSWFRQSYEAIHTILAL
jgi:hypothetical protein